jgi:D-arginine dehydrogenase
MESSPIRCDVAIVGAGIAGASLAAEIAPNASVVLIEAEAQPGYHATGRSAAFWSETYGGPAIVPLTQASGDALENPAPGFSDRSFLTPRGALHIADRESGPVLGGFLARFGDAGVTLDRVERPALEALIPGLRPGWDSAVREATCADIDVAALHAAYLRAAQRAGTRLLCDAPLRAAARNGKWRLETGGGIVEADILVDAAGAWADPVAVLAGAQPLGIVPFRRTVLQLRVAPGVPEDLPLIMDAAARFYFKPVAGGRIWLSPHDETPALAGDAAAEEIDVALAIDRLQSVVDWRIEAVERRWAGLRSFAPDRLPVYGFDPLVPGFFWFAGQGGFGIQTAPAAAALAAALLLGRTPAPMVAAIDAAAYAPGRFS